MNSESKTTNPPQTRWPRCPACGSHLISMVIYPEGMGFIECFNCDKAESDKNCDEAVRKFWSEGN